MSSNRRLRLALAAAAVIAAGVLATLLAAPGTTPARSSDPHADPHLSASRRARLLNATAAAATSASPAALVAEGRRLFRDNRVARQGESCQSCHTEGGENSAVGTIAHPLSAADFTGPREPPTLWDAARTAPYGWTGTTPTLRNMVVKTIVGHFVTGGSQPADVTGRQAAALLAYIGTLRAPRTTFDDGTLSASAQRGLRLFQTKGGCTACHGGPDFTDNLEHATCVPQAVPGANDPGATLAGMFVCPQQAGDPVRPGAFNTPQLRGLSGSAPYMHNGSMKTLRDVVNFYNTNSSVSPLRLTPGEIDDLVAFLASL